MTKMGTGTFLVREERASPHFSQENNLFKKHLVTHIISTLVAKKVLTKVGNI